MNDSRDVPNARPLRAIFLRVGGWEKWVDTVASYLARNGVQVTGLVFLPKPMKPPRTAPGVRVITEVVPRPALGKLSATWRAGRLVRRHLAQNTYNVLYVVDSWSVPTLLA